MIVVWWLALQLFGLAVLPLTLRIFQFLPTRGWAFARPVGLLLVGFFFWQGATFGFLSNTWASIFGALLVVAMLVWILFWREVVLIPAFVRERRSLVVATEILFTLAFLIWVFFRSYNPDISATEKPMELAFLNGVLRSEQFPPLDPWLSGYTISYYYFGYVITGMIARFTGVPAQFAFNLMIPTLFALTATGAFALGSDMHLGARAMVTSVRKSVAAGLLAVTMVLLMSNLEPVLEVMNANRALSPEASAYFSIKDMPPSYQSRSLFPTDPPDGWWWFRATRVVGTPGANGSTESRDYTINEFPFFSFLLGDLHPHVLVLPFVLVALGFALNLLRTPGTLTFAKLRRQPLFVGSVAILFGGLGFLNAWDMPTFLFVLAASFAVHRVLTTGAITRRVVRDVLYGSVGALLVSVLVYLPFYFGFRSQASGLGIVIVHTQIQHFLLFWGPLYTIIVTFIAARFVGSWRDVEASDWTRSPFVWAAVAVVAIVSAVLQAPVVALTLPPMVGALAVLSRAIQGPALARSVKESRSATATAPRLTETIEIAGGAIPVTVPREQLFALILGFTGLLLIMGCELVFIGDLFRNRMNTVFKLYYQAWMMLAVAGAYAIPHLLGRLFDQSVELRFKTALRGFGYAWSALVTLMILAGLLYMVGATNSKARGFAESPTLDGLAFWSRIRADDAAAIAWMQSNIAGAPVVVEATGGSYQQQFGRISSMTGLPTLLGWAFHEQQWRGSFEELGRRKPVIDTIYTSNDPRQVRQLFDQYNVSYVYVGPTERDAYRDVNFDRFAQYMDIVYRNNGVTIYGVRGRST